MKRGCAGQGLGCVRWHAEATPAALALKGKGGEQEGEREREGGREEGINSRGGEGVWESGITNQTCH